MQISNVQFDRMVADQWRERVDRSLRKAVPGYADIDKPARDEFLVQALADATQAGFVTEQGAAGYVLGALYLDSGFQARSPLLTALLASGLPEFRRLHAMNAWIEATIGDPRDPAGADDAMRKAFDMTHAWGRGAGNRR